MTTLRTNDEELLLTEGRRMFVLAAAVLERDVLLHGLTDDEQTVLVGAVLNAAKRIRLKERDEARKALHGIANAVRLGAETDVLAWKNLADACQRTARTALPEKHSG